MNSSEERYTAWLDGQLSEPESAAFLATLENPAAAVADRSELEKMRGLLREHARAPQLANPDFFTHQILRQIESERPAQHAPVRGWQLWSWPRLALAGFAALLVAGGLFQALIPVGAPSNDPLYFAQIVSAEGGDPEISVSTVWDPDENVTVLWVDGLDYLDASYTLK